MIVRRAAGHQRGRGGWWWCRCGGTGGGGAGSDVGFNGRWEQQRHPAARSERYGEDSRVFWDRVPPVVEINGT